MSDLGDVEPKPPTVLVAHFRVVMICIEVKSNYFRFSVSKTSKRIITFVEKRHYDVGLVDCILISRTQVDFIFVYLSLLPLLLAIFSCFQLLVDV